jgi:hypothetical protein
MAAGRLPHRRALLDADAVDALALARLVDRRPEREVAP